MKLRGNADMGADYILGGIVTLMLVVYLVLALLRPERF
ncbi:K(+)-transporting ATPase subunit F [Mesorhizobium sp. KR2-14]